ncbi:HhH-GPD base excision DNA repair family protein [Perilla frutescens var. hirtella]|uniref:HhH-GPD base excision DNA repair family protein n=1 Tax=Perilla frutescens var. hirtella TaxID=608512 RepID=A0AAD4PBS5_PERFH|nr:HhH-GPD base excision DNA repair family protein [Perilla frutescens var. hirtella]
MAKDSDPDWVPITPDILTKKNGSNRLRGKPSALLSKSKSLTATNLLSTTAGEEMKTLEASLCVHQLSKSLKKRRIMRKRSSLNKLIELTRMVHDLMECARDTFNLAWMTVKRERSNTVIRRQNFSSLFAAHVVKESDEQCKNHLDDVNTQNRAAEFKTRFQPDKYIIIYKRKGKRNDSNSAVDFGKHKMESDVPNQVDQKDNASVVRTCDDPSSSSFKILDPSMSEQNGCDGHVIVAEPHSGKNDESNSNTRVEEDIDSGNKANAVIAEENVNDWVPLTPEIQSKVGPSNNIAPYSAKTGSNCGNYESLLEILKNKGTHGVDSEKKPRKRLKMKRHRPKVFDRSKPVKISTPNPRTPKLARKVKKKVDPMKNDRSEATRDSCKRKLDFNEECCTTSREELNLKPQDSTESSISEPPTICRKKRKMRLRLSREKLSNLIRMVRDVSTIPELTYPKMKKLKISSDFGVEEELPCNVLCTCGTKRKIPEHNVLSIQDEALTEAMVDYAVQKMASLRIDDKVSKQLVVRDSNKFGAIVSSKKKKIDPSKNHKVMVDLDPETMRIWDLLMGPNWSESTEAEGVDDVEYIKGERKLFRQKVDKFLACMRVYQGDRRFSPWKGSVVDSIVGVFLTQNVSDHLSSSAYMALASTYPPLSLSEQNAQLARDDQQWLLVEPPSSSQVDIENANESSSLVEATPVTKKGKGKEKQEKPINWDELRKQYSDGIPIKRTDHNADSINWKAVRQSSAEDLAKVIVNRGMSNQLAGRIKDFLDRLVRDHGSIDLEWLRNVPPPKAKDYLLSISGLGLKSTECVRLLALHFPAFPVDTNAGRFFVRVGWVPLKPLPDSLQLHLLNQYPVLDSVQKYLWPRICDRSHPTLYETHCHSVTVAKTFCTKTQPNCKECPMRGECRHYASAVASSRPHLEGSQPKTASDSSTMSTQEAPLLTNFDGDQSEKPYNSCISEPIIEFPASPGPESEPEPTEALGGDIEDIWRDCEIPTITLNGVEFSEKIRSFISEGDAISKALVALSPKVASIPMPKLKEAIRLRTVHQVYELPDSHHLLAAFENREPEDPCPYLLAIWTADETANSSQESDRVRSSQETTTGDACSSREVARYEKHDKVQGTILIPCRTANRGRFPLNGTYFQTNEVFADHASSRQPIDVPRESIWNLRKRTLYCGTSITSICKGMSDLEVAYCFQKSSICNRGFNTKTRAATSLAKRFHICKSRQPED